MINYKFYILLIALSLISCTSSDKEIKLFGNWEEVIEDKLTNEGIRIPPRAHKYYGIGFKENRIKFFNGLISVERDSNSNDFRAHYYGNFMNYRINEDSIFVYSPITKEWSYKWSIKEISEDTLKLVAKSGIIIKYTRINYDNNKSIDYDQIVLSRSGCFGFCPKIDISLKRNNDIIFRGENFVEAIGVYNTVVKDSISNMVFEKISKIDLKKTLNNYATGRTDDETITTSFIKNGKIIKTISDYGRDGPKELVWAYVTLGNLHSFLKFKELPVDSSFYQELGDFEFIKDSLILRLKRSESFFLWMELKKSNIVDELIDYKYNVLFRNDRFNVNWNKGKLFIFQTILY